MPLSNIPGTIAGLFERIPKHGNRFFVVVARFGRPYFELVISYTVKAGDMVDLRVCGVQAGK